MTNRFLETYQPPAGIVIENPSEEKETSQWSVCISCPCGGEQIVYLAPILLEQAKADDLSVLYAYEMFLHDGWSLIPARCIFCREGSVRR